MIQHADQKITDHEQEVFRGLVFIPDISGFTELVRATDLKTGTQITCELLSAIISANILQMKVAEIEGDAVLFYYKGAVPSIHTLFKQFEQMVICFHKKRIELENKFSMSIHLSLKVVAHYGYMSAYEIGPFRKLYGEVVVAAHRLLKNSIDSGSYLLLTDSIFNLPHDSFKSELLKHGIRTNKLCEVYEGLTNICFSYFDFSERRSWKQVA